MDSEQFSHADQPVSGAGGSQEGSGEAASQETTSTNGVPADVNVVSPGSVLSLSEDDLRSIAGLVSQQLALSAPSVSYALFLIIAFLINQHPLGPARSTPENAY